MFQAIYAETAAPKLVDWMEINALLHEYCECATWSLLRAVGLAEDEVIDAFTDTDIADNEDMEQESLLARVEREIERRLAALGVSYPFSYEDGVLRLQPIDDTSLAGCLTYLLCLRLSFPVNDVVEISAFCPIDTWERNLFQSCANIAAAGYLGGKVYAFGWPRPDKTRLLQALVAVEQAMGNEGEVKTCPPDEAPIKPKDDELDVVAWIPHADGPGCALTLWGQVASGANWKDKPLSTDKITQFWRRWYHKPPPLHPVRAMFIPFTVFDEEHDKDTGLYKRKLQDHAVSYGLIFHRYRLPAYVQRAFDRGDEASVMKEASLSNVKSGLWGWWEWFQDVLKQAHLRSAKDVLVCLGQASGAAE